MAVSTPLDVQLLLEVQQALFYEAELLDERRWQEWLDFLTEDVTYQMPVRVTKEYSLNKTFLTDMDHFHENRHSLEKRVERLSTEYAWAEDPPSRTRHFVTNVRIYPEPTGEELIAKSYLLLFRSRGDERPHDLISAERVDTLRRVDGALRLAKRMILVDESVLRTQNLAIFL